MKTTDRRALAEGFGLFGTALSGFAAMLLIMICPALTACSSDDLSEYSGSASGAQKLTLVIAANGESDLNTRAAGDEYAGDDGEFINTLCLFIVDEDGKIEYKFTGDDLSDNDKALAATGNLQSCTVDMGSASLSLGDKTVYAFANWATADNSAWTAITALGIGNSLTPDMLAISLDDPAANVDIENGMYIPMSGTQTMDAAEDINYTSRTVLVTLDRLVGKMDITLEPGEDEGATVYKLTFSGLADKVALFNEYKPSETASNTIEFTLINSETTISKGETYPCGTFYVNETERTATEGGFPVYMELYKETYGESVYTATTNTTAIPRNYIYPLVLSLDTYECSLNDVKGYASPISGMESEYEISDAMKDTDGHFIVSVPDVTTSVSFTPVITTEGTTVTGVTWTLTDSDGTSVTATDGALTTTSFNAVSSTTYSYTLSGEWTDGIVTHSRQYAIEIDFTSDRPVYKAPYLWRKGVAGAGEVLNMLQLKRATD